MRTRVTSVVLLTFVWLFLWNEVTPWLVVGGVLTAIIVTTAFPFPKAPWVATVRPYYLALLLGRFVVVVVRELLPQADLLSSAIILCLEIIGL